jgi:hypothetical protein
MVMECLLDVLSPRSGGGSVFGRVWLFGSYVGLGIGWVR